MKTQADSTVSKVKLQPFWRVTESSLFHSTASEVAAFLEGDRIIPVSQHSVKRKVAVYLEGARIIPVSQYCVKSKVAAFLEGDRIIPVSQYSLKS